MSDPLGLISNASQGPSPIAPISPPGSARGAAGLQPGQPSFKDVLMQNIQQVNELQQDAEVAIEDLAAGKRTDMDQVLMAKQKADVAFQLLLQVRNKMMDAYDEVKQIRV